MPQLHRYHSYSYHSNISYHSYIVTIVTLVAIVTVCTAQSNNSVNKPVSIMKTFQTFFDTRIHKYHTTMHWYTTPFLNSHDWPQTMVLCCIYMSSFYDNLYILSMYMRKIDQFLDGNFAKLPNLHRQMKITTKIAHECRCGFAV